MERAAKKIQPINTSTEVSVQEKTFLVCGNLKVPVHATCASKFSLFFRYTEDQHLPDTEEPVNLLIDNNGQSVEIGPCRILADAGNNGYAGRLVSVKDVYDFQQLLQRKKLVKLQAGFEDLPLLFERKAKIKPEFKAYVADLKYDLQVYKDLFDNLDSQCQDEPVEIKELVQEAVFESEGQKFRKFFQNTVDELTELVNDFSREEHQVHGFYFRKQLWDFILCCPLMTRTNLKPRGYAGDSEMMRMVYANSYEGKTMFGKLLHKYSVGIPTGDSVRWRKAIISDMLPRTRTRACHAPGEKIDALSVACGPAYELQDILTSSQDFGNYHFCLLDQDPHALQEASQVVLDIEKKFCATVQAEYVQKSVRWMFGKKTFLQDFSKFNFIYSMGLFDYFVPRIAKAVLSKLYQLLVPGGEIIVGNFHVSNPDQYFLEYWGDWHLIYRTEKDLLGLFDKVPSSDVSVIFDDRGIQMFLHIKKK